VSLSAFASHHVHSTTIIPPHALQSMHGVLHTVGKVKYDVYLRFTILRICMDFLQLFLLVMRPEHGASELGCNSHELACWHERSPGCTSPAIPMRAYVQPMLLPESTLVRVAGRAALQGGIFAEGTCVAWCCLHPQAQQPLHAHTQASKSTRNCGSGWPSTGLSLPIH